MGPRARARGNGHHTSEHARSPNASMGPRARARGNDARNRPCIRRKDGFNGAASACSRKSQRPGRAQWRGPASMGPRARARGNQITQLVNDNTATLQWGRERVLAEMIWVYAAAQAACLASMGPRARARGNPVLNSYSSGNLHRFNGAASACSRKYVPLIRPTQTDVASMGPRARARGNVELFGDVTVLLVASMGPRARARGNNSSATWSEISVSLQWGRERVLAEISSAGLSPLRD